MMEPTEEFQCEYMYMGIFDVGEKKQRIAAICKYNPDDLYTCKFIIGIQKNCPLGHGKSLKWLD